jgi:hypothetical protein
MHPKQKKPKAATTRRDDPEQSRLFMEKARELGADKRQSATDKLIGHLAKKPPEPRKKPK